MEIKSAVMPEKAFQVLHVAGKCVVEFFDGARAEAEIDKRTGQKITVWSCEKYTLTVPDSPGLADDIENDYAAWLKRAKDAELAAEERKARACRDSLLDAADAECSAEQRGRMTDDRIRAWEEYKQALREVPEQAGFPLVVNWPAMPEI